VFPGWAWKANVSGVEREPGAMETAVKPDFANWSTKILDQLALGFVFIMLGLSL
jgi:hypothetical protein